MTPFSRPSIIVTAVLLVVTVVVTPRAAAQSEEDLRNENEQLKQQVEDLTEQLGQANERIAQLEAQIRQLQEALREAGAAPPSGNDETRVTIDESQPHASPRALFNALRKDYEDAVDGLEVGQPDDRARAAYLRAVERFTAAANREYRDRIEWHVRLYERPQERNPRSIKLVAVDPVTGVELGAPFVVRLSRVMQRRLEHLESRGVLDDTFVMRGVLSPRLRMDEDMLEPGPFQQNRLIGPFVVFNFQIEPQTFLTVEEKQEEDAANPDDAG